MDHSIVAAVLVSLFDLAREGKHAHMGNVAGRLGISRAEVVRALKLLEQKGLVEAHRCRLTMAGLAVSASLRADARARAKAKAASPRASAVRASRRKAA
ncbi:MAG: hypothetical protein U0230_12760 [Polyangiales bacterium]